LPALLLWGNRDEATVLRRTEAGHPDRWTELSVPPGWDYAAAPDSVGLVAIRGAEAKFGQVAAEGIVLDSVQSFLWVEEGLTAACVGTGTPAAFLGVDDNHFMILTRDGGWAKVDAVGTVGDCTWLDRDRLLTVGQGAGDPMTLHTVTAASDAPSGIGGTDPYVSGGLLVVRDRSLEPGEIVVWRVSLVGGDGQGQAVRLLPAEVARLRPAEPGVRYLSGTASPDRSWLAIVGDEELADGSTASRLWLIDLGTPELTPMSVPLDFPLTAVSWPD
jgi:hypothetical protein